MEGFFWEHSSTLADQRTRTRNLEQQYPNREHSVNFYTRKTLFDLIYNFRHCKFISFFYNIPTRILSIIISADGLSKTVFLPPKIGVRSAYTLPFPNPTCGITPVRLALDK
ncbi:hypothetical protein K7X08_021663 [Anisodus acutangulus]|uniref:Uncharacterized protein n=1 Tax=Anisodus acutangulus TaxID=402998 RepID=A0A9Q1RBG5_9SOLA|nr:hypothetical protein K7X08_021663 [Anisodus acutangulus]